MKNSQQIEYWNGEVGLKWRDNYLYLETMFDEITNAFCQNIGNVKDLRILDLGCGAGALAQRIASKCSKFVGIDLSKPLLEIALKSRIENTEFLQTDILDYCPEEKFDLAISRFGLMFFEDKIEGFRRVRELMKPNARLVFMVWQTPQDNEWVRIPMNALEGIAQAQSANNPDAPGPFALANLDLVFEILSIAGFKSVTSQSVESEMPFAMNEGLGGAVKLLAKIGPASRSITQLSPEMRKIAEAKLQTALLPFLRNNTVYLKGAVRIISALA